MLGMGYVVNFERIIGSNSFRNLPSEKRKVVFGYRFEFGGGVFWTFGLAHFSVEEVLNFIKCRKKEKKSKKMGVKWVV